MKTNHPPHGTIESDQYSLLKARLGLPEIADELLCKVESKIALHPLNYELVSLSSSQRVAVVRLKRGGAQVPFAIYFTIKVGRIVEFDSLCEGWLPVSVQLSQCLPVCHLPLAA